MSQATHQHRAGRWLFAIAVAIVAGFIAVMCGPIAHAQEVAAAAAPAGPDAGQLAVTITGIVVSLAALAATALGLWKWLGGKAKGWGAALDQKTGVPIFGVIFEKAVAAFSIAAERGGPLLREVTADGKVDPVEWDKFKKLGIDILTTFLHPAELDALNASTGGNAAAYLDGIAPHAIAESKRRGDGAKTAPAPAAPPADPSGASSPG